MGQQENGGIRPSRGLSLQGNTPHTHTHTHTHTLKMNYMDILEVIQRFLATKLTLNQEESDLNTAGGGGVCFLFFLAF